MVKKSKGMDRTSLEASRELIPETLSWHLNQALSLNANLVESAFDTYKYFSTTNFSLNVLTFLIVSMVSLQSHVVPDYIQPPHNKDYFSHHVCTYINLMAMGKLVCFRIFFIVQSITSCGWINLLNNHFK